MLCPAFSRTYLFTPLSRIRMDPSASYANCQVSAKLHDPTPHECQEGLSQNAVQDLDKAVQDRNNFGWRKIVINFSPAWFSVNMGTGIVSILLNKFPYPANWLYWLSVVVFCLNIVLFFVFLIISIMRYTMYEGIFLVMIRHPVQSFFVGTFPVGFATIVIMVALVCEPAWGPRAGTLAYALWWIDVAIALLCNLWMPFVVMRVHHSDISRMTAVWLLPVVSTVVAAACGGIVAAHLPDHRALITIITSYILFGTGFPLALVILVMYFHRLTIFHLPPREIIVSAFLPLGLLAQGAFVPMQLGKIALKVFPAEKTLDPTAGRLFYNVGILSGLIFYGYSLVWLFFAVASISLSKFPFNMGWWGFTFPVGVFGLAAITFGQDLPSKFFKVLGTIISVITILLWLGISLETTRRSITGELFTAPCVPQYLAARAARREAKKHDEVGENKEV